MGDGDSSIWYWVAVGVLLLLSALFSSSETSFFAFYSISKTAKRSRKRSSRGRKDKALKRVKDILKEPSRLLTAIIFGNLIVNITASSLIEHMLKFDSFILSVAVVTAVLLIVGEITPKILAVNFYERVAVFNAKIMRFIIPVLSVITKPFEKIASFVITLVGKIFRYGEKRPFKLDVEGLSRIIEESELNLTEQEKELIDKVLKVARISAAEMMTPRVNIVSFKESSLMEEVVKKIKSEPHMYYPVYREKHDIITGILPLKKILPDVVKSSVRGKLNRKVRFETPMFAVEKETLLNLLQSFKSERKKVAVIVDEYGATVGIITLSDLLGAVGGSMLEGGEESGGIEKREEPGGELYYVVDASVPIVRFNEKVNADFSAEGYTSVGGLVLKAMEDRAEKEGSPMKIPQKGDSFEIDGFLFTVEEADERQIKKVRVKPLRKSGSHRSGNGKKNGSRNGERRKS